MPLYSFEGRSPTIDPTAFVAPTATLIGDVHVEAGASVWFNAVIRADFAPIIVREGANVQDCCVLHAPPGIPVDVGPGATVAHGCVIHGVHIGAEAVIANHATVLDGVVIGARSLIAAHALVVGGTKIPDEVLVTGGRRRSGDRSPERARRCGLTPTPALTKTWPVGICRGCRPSRSCARSRWRGRPPSRRAAPPACPRRSPCR